MKSAENVLVTGGCGLIGYHAAMYYKRQGCEVWVLDNFERSRLLGHDVSPERMLYNYSKLQKAGVHTITQDVSSQDTLNRIPSCDLVIHLAAQCGVPTSISDPRRDFEVNALGTLNVLEYARENQSCVVYASTNKVYPLHDGWIKTDNAGVERWEWSDPYWREHGFPLDGAGRPMKGSRTPYGASKYYGDLLMQEYHHIYGIPTGVFRMSCIYGDHQFGFAEQGWATWFAIATLKGWPLTIYGDGKQVRDMLWVGDVIKAYDSYVQSSRDHGIWNLGGGPKFTLSLDECLDILEDITGKRSPVTYEDWRPSDQRVYTSHIEPLENDLGWKPRVSPREGLERVVAWAETCLDIF